MINQTLSTIIAKGMNNPDCAFFVGQMMGNYTFYTSIGTILIIIVILRSIDKLALLPFLEWIKKRLYRK